jgi:hypothetical protein
MFDAVSGDDLIPTVEGQLVKALGQRCPGIDEITLSYAGRAQECFLAAHYEASVLLLGAASEAALIRLANSLNACRVNLSIPSIREATVVRRLDQLETVFRQHGESIKQALVAARLEAKWVDDVPRSLTGANAIRLTRNDAGHPIRVVGRGSKRR